MSDHLVVVTGGPGAGKSTLIDRLAGLGYATMPEAGRAIIQAYRAIEGPALPWKDQDLFAELILSWEMRSHRQAAAADGLVFFDRGVPDVLGDYCRRGARIPDHVRAATESFRYCPTVFIAPPWPEIYSGDEERMQSFGEAERTYEAMVTAYTDCGYDLVELPRADVATRAGFVLDRLRG